MKSDFEEARRRMVQEQLIPRSIRDPATIAAMSTVPRHLFVPPEAQLRAYYDGPIPIKEGQTISQPYIVALMTQAAELGPDSIALEIGTGSGYAAAVLSRIAREIYTIERIPSLAKQAEELLKHLGYHNVQVKIDDGTLGWPEKGPFDAIIVTAAAPKVPTAYLDQLKLAGRLIIPVGDTFSQELLRLRKTGDHAYSQEILEYVRFVPLIGKEGWQENK
jgi:protein-L-isoaspartate(D-aspartate) O-methyltransferase